MDNESLTDSDENGDVGKNLQVLTTPELPKPEYDDEEFAKLQQYIQHMTMLFALDHRDWSEETLDIIRRWLTEVDHLMLTIFYDCNKLTACLGFPLAPVSDLSYFLRMPNQIFYAETFHDEVNFGTIHEDVDGCLLRVLESVYSPIFRSFDGWNENIRLRFSKALDMFLCYLTGLHYKMAGMALLYVPYVVKQICKEGIAHNREFVRNLESIAVYWTKQMRTLLSDKTLAVQNDFVVPADEYEFWLYRYEVLYGLNAQLQLEDVEQIINILRVTHSVYLKQLDDLINECKMEMKEARSNITFLRLLIEPCSKIDMATSPAEVPHLLSRIIHIIRYIWNKSEFYCRRDLITGLFRNLSNQIIKFCLEKCNIEKILQGNSRFGIKLANLSIDCCLSYRAIYDILSKEHIARSSKHGWDLDNAMIFNHVDAFMERLNDVIDICEAMIVFARLDETENIPAPRFGGTNGAEFEKTAKRVEKEFLKLLNNLETDSKDIILNVNKNEWYDQVLLYRRAVQTFEETIQRLLSNVFQRVCNIEETLEALNVTLFYSFRANIRKAYLREVSEMWVNFEKEMENTSKMLMDRLLVHESWLPYFVSKGINYRINMERLTWLHGRIINSEWLPIVSEADIVHGKFEKLKKHYEKETRRSFDEWSLQCCNYNITKKLDRTLLIRSKEKVGLLECNMDPSLMNICEQALLFETMGFPAPSSIKKVFDKYDVIKFTYNSVVKVCLDYNRILEVLSNDERKLFRALIKACDRKIAPGLFKLTWGGEMSDVYIADCAKHTSKLQDSQDIYKRANRHIKTLCEKICDTPFLKIVLFGATELKTFKGSIMAFCDKAMETIMICYNTIVELLFAVYREFMPVMEEMILDWIQYLQKFDDMLATALMVTARNSLTNILRALQYQGDVPPSPILITKLDIADRELQLDPSAHQMSKLFRDLCLHIGIVLENYPRLTVKFELPASEQRTSFSVLFTRDQECIGLREAITYEVLNSNTEILEFIDCWYVYRHIWEKTEEELLKFLRSTNMAASIFEESINFYMGLAEEITLSDTISSVYFVFLNQTNIKTTLLDMIEKWQILHLRILLQHSTSKLKCE